MRPRSPSLDRTQYLSHDTIAAIATAQGGALSIIRISGPDAFALLARVAPDAADFAPRKLELARITDPVSGAALDEAMAARFVAPASFTGEDVVELHLHGGAYISTRVLDALLASGARQALPGEFSFRAVRNGKLALTQAEAIADLIAAKNDSAVSLALEKLSGTQNRLVAALEAELRHLAAMGEVGIDFADQDVEEVSLPALKKRLTALRKQLERLHASFARGTRIQEGVSCVFVGVPNAGKSSFFNALLGEDRSIVSDQAGTTRDLVREGLTLRGARGSVTLRLEDTAGLRLGADAVEAQGIERTLRAASAADVVIFVYDPTLPHETNLEQWLRLGARAGAGLAERTVGILTKRDRLSPAELRSAREQAKSLGIPRWADTSAMTGEGLNAAIDQIVSFTESLLARAAGEVLLTRADHREAVAQCLQLLAEAQDAPELDLFAADVRHALIALSPLIGQTLPDDILGRIFSEFCIGK